MILSIIVVRTTRYNYKLQDFKVAVTSCYWPAFSDNSEFVDVDMEC